MAHSDLTFVESLALTTTNAEQGEGKSYIAPYRYVRHSKLTLIDAVVTISITTADEEGEAKAKATISSLPPELHLKIFTYLDRASSVCFSLTAKKLYPIHKELRGLVPLTACCVQAPSRSRGRFLFGLLKEWIKETGLVFSGAELKFITLEKKSKMKEDDLIWRFYNWGSFDQSPLAKKLVKAKEARRLEILRDEKEDGGWWEKGVWIDGEESGKGGQRWVELAYEGVEFEGIGDDGTGHAWI
jgi:hypothetical protein